MPVKKNPDGQRSVEAEVEVPGSPEDVWRAIATGNGISSWFVPSTVDERVGGAARSNFGPGMESAATITSWNPPQSFVAETAEEPPGKVATEWTVEARAGGTCVVRVIHRWFASTDDWDAQFEGHTHGWVAFFRILRLYLAHFSGQPCSTVQITGFSKAPMPETWRSVISSLTFDEPRRRVTGASAAPVLAAIVEREGNEAHPELLLRLDRPAPGLAHLFVMPMGGQVIVSIRFFFYGDQAKTAATEAERDWTDWLARKFPPAVSA
jgi:uncharacterized protein YndB with AHSA1/START domain